MSQLAASRREELRNKTALLSDREAEIRALEEKLSSVESVAPDTNSLEPKVKELRATRESLDDEVSLLDEAINAAQEKLRQPPDDGLPAKVELPSIQDVGQLQQTVADLQDQLKVKVEELGMEKERRQTVERRSRGNERALYEGTGSTQYEVPPAAKPGRSRPKSTHILRGEDRSVYNATMLSGTTKGTFSKGRLRGSGASHQMGEDEEVARRLLRRVNQETQLQDVLKVVAVERGRHPTEDMELDMVDTWNYLQQQKSVDASSHRAQRARSSSGRPTTRTARRH